MKTLRDPKLRRSRIERLTVDLRIKAGATTAILSIVLMQLSTTAATAQFAYLGFARVMPSLTDYALVSVTAFMIGFCAPTGNVTPGRLVIWLLALLTAVPTVAIAPSIDREGIDSLVAVVVGGYALLAAAYAFWPVRGSPARKARRSQYVTVLVSLGFGFTGFAVLTYGLRLAPVSFQDMYSVRGEFEAATAGSANALGPYARSVAITVLSPALIAVGIVWRRWLWLLSGLTIQVIMYLVVPQKINIMLSIAVVVLAYIIRRRALTLSRLVIVVSASVLAIAFLFREPGNPVFSSTLFRTFFVPIDVGLMWIEYFSTGERGYFADAMFSPGFR